MWPLRSLPMVSKEARLSVPTAVVHDAAWRTIVCELTRKSPL